MLHYFLNDNDQYLENSNYPKALSIFLQFFKEFTLQLLPKNNSSVVLMFTSEDVKSG